MYDIELETITREIKARNAKMVLVQLPDGLKPKAREIVGYIEQNTDAKAFIWLSSCYGGCDIPLGLNTVGIDMLIAFGHNKFNRQDW